MVDSAQLAAAIADATPIGLPATVVGYGLMGGEYVKALRALGAGDLRVCGRSPERLASLRDVGGIEAFAGGIEHFEAPARPGELAIVAAPPPLLIPAAERLADLGYRRLLIEKPVSLWSAEIAALAERLRNRGVEASCAFNRTAYPAFYEVMDRIEREGGATSCTYEFTELIKPDWPERFPAGELARWGVANSLHVISMAHGLVGQPATWHASRSGADPIPWHPAGTVFAAAGTTDSGIPYTCHADWNSTGRWVVEVHSREASYRLCPLEKVLCRPAALADWEDVPVATADAGVKAGILEQVALSSGAVEAPFVSWDLDACARLTRYTEDLCGYEAAPVG